MQRILSSILFLFLVAVFQPNAADADVKISLVTCAPGSEIYELEGHEALRFRFADGRDITANWGLFDFNTPNFAYRFTKGETDYRVGATPTYYFIESYQRQGRRITEYPLLIDSITAARVVALVMENLTPEHAVYRYNYVKDNCATRPIGIIETALGDTISFPDPKECSGKQTFRSIMRHYHSNYPWYQFGIDLALGSGIDYTLSNREKIFAPVLLGKMSDEITVNGNKLLGEPVILSPGYEAGTALPPTPFFLAPDFICWLIFIITALITYGNYRHGVISKWFDRLIYSIFGLLGLLLTFLIFVSVHEATSPNYLYLWLNPLAFIVVIGIGINKLKSLVFCYQILNFVALISLLLIAICGVQHLNSAFYPLILSDLLRSAIYIYHHKCHAKKLN